MFNAVTLIIANVMIMWLAIWLGTRAIGQYAVYNKHPEGKAIIPRQISGLLAGVAVTVGFFSTIIAFALIADYAKPTAHPWEELLGIIPAMASVMLMTIARYLVPLIFRPKPARPKNPVRGPGWIISAKRTLFIGPEIEVPIFPGELFYGGVATRRESVTLKDFSVVKYVLIIKATHETSCGDFKSIVANLPPTLAEALERLENPNAESVANVISRVTRSYTTFSATVSDEFLYPPPAKLSAPTPA